MNANFSLYPDADGSRYSLKRDGDETVAHFTSLSKAFRYARSCPDILGAKIVLHDIYGKETLEFPVTSGVAEGAIERSGDPLDELAALVEQNLQSKECYQAPQHWIDRCWELKFHCDSRWRKSEIEAFAAEHRWAVEMKYQADGFCVEFRKTGGKDIEKV